MYLLIWKYAIYPPDFRVMGIWNIVMQVANGLAFIHHHNEVHRDLKPRNGISRTT